MSSQIEKTIGATLLVAGNCIGGGMMIMPVLTGLGGYIPGILMTTLIWLCMFATANLLVEAVLGMRPGANIVSLATHYFGRWSRTVVGILFFLFYFILVVSYPVASLPSLNQFFLHTFQVQIPLAIERVFFSLILIFFLYVGIRLCALLNLLLLCLFFVTFFSIIGQTVGHIQGQYLLRHDWTFMFLSAPILFTAFSFHGLVPPLVTYLNRDAKRIKGVIFWGTLLSFLTYLIWQALVIGTLAEGTLWEIFETGAVFLNMTELMRNTPWLGSPSSLLVFFALTTSLIGISIGLIDIIEDWAGIAPEERRGKKRLIICSALLIPALAAGGLLPHVFAKVMSELGDLAFAIFNGIIPPALAWKARYSFSPPPPGIVPGGKFVLLFLIVLTIYIICLQGIILIY